MRRPRDLPHNGEPCHPHLPSGKEGIRGRLKLRSRIYREFQRRYGVVSCGFINRKLKLSDREWQCPSCRVSLDRDLNAAVNIERRGKMGCLGMAFAQERVAEMKR